ncbi:hypothetical protein CBR_g49299 [Chara braunii]|uniref:Peptidase A2 domain-containing protein n=1 Tax=Chara braunii TaxID=69332 RepID=A0A388M4K1_CHABU|nr:hypothetical protein CBR_g49299 [Chara braunii]|eukprot:GBG89508.1 hypothetical protein CBR_g49299 [Chara braunii]
MKVAAGANGEWTKFKEEMQRRFKLGDGLLTKEDLEMLRRGEFSTVGAFATTFEKMAKKVQGLAEEEQCATFLGHFKNWEGSSLTKKAAPGKKLTWAAIKEGVMDGELDQVVIFQMRQARKKRKALDATTSDGRDFKKMIEDAVAQLDAKKEAKRKTMAAPQIVGKAKKAVVQEKEEEEEEEEPEPQKLTKAQRKARNLAQGGQGSGRGQVPQAVAMPPPESSYQAVSAPYGPWPGCGPSSHWHGHCSYALWPMSGPHGSCVGPSMSAASCGCPGPQAQQEVVEPPVKEEEEDDRLRNEEGEKAEQRAKKRGVKADTKKVPEQKRKKYTVRVEKGFDVEEIMDRILEGHNHLMNLKDVLASVPRLREELKARLCRKMVASVRLGAIIPKEAEWSETGTKMNWKSVACGCFDVVVKRKACTAMVDTGAEMNLIKEEDALRLRMEIDRSDNGILVGANSRSIFVGTASKVVLEIGKWMMDLALADKHQLGEDLITMEDGARQVEDHERSVGGVYLLANALLQEEVARNAGQDQERGENVIYEREDDDFKEGEIKEAFRAEEYDGVYLELGMFLSCEIRERDASEKVLKMRPNFLVRDEHLFMKSKGRNPRRVVCGITRQIDVIAALHDGTAGGHRNLLTLKGVMKEGFAAARASDQKIGERLTNVAQKAYGQRVEWEQETRDLKENQERQDRELHTMKVELEKAWAGNEAIRQVNQTLDKVNEALRAYLQAQQASFQTKEVKWEKRIKELEAKLEQRAPTTLVDWTEVQGFEMKKPPAEEAF